MAVCAVGILFGLHRKPEPTVTARALLAEADAREEHPDFGAQPGVVYQRLQVHDGDHQTEWLVYRDRQGKRKARFQPPSASESRLRKRLAAAGIMREDPLSVSSYRNWRLRLTAYRDTVVFSPSGLILVKTSTAADPETPVQEESLLLRATDYHPISRSVTFRDAEQVEIAELDYRVLDWAHARKDWFEDVEAAALPAMRVATQTVPLVKAIHIDAAELDLAELRTRLILSTHDADTGEQIELVRAPDGIQVQGLLTSPERKRELGIALQSVPHVSASIETAEERAARETTASSPSHIKLIESTSQASPLLIFLKSRGESIDSYRRLSGRIMESGLRIRQQCHSLAELQDKFAHSALDQTARQVYEQVWDDHITKLKSALRDQDEVLRSASRQDPDTSPSQMETGAASLRNLADHASRSLALSRELVAGDGGSQRDALMILNDLFQENSSLTNGLTIVCDSSEDK